MKKLKILWLLIFTLSMFMESAFPKEKVQTAQKQAKFNIVADYTLSNGLRVVCIEKGNLPIVCFSVLYKCGSINEVPPKSGIAHYLEHMAFCGNDSAFSNFLEDVGADMNAFTSFRRVFFYEILSIDHLETVCRYESRRMEKLDFDIKKFRTEKGAITEERSMRIDNNPQGEYSETIIAELYGGSYGGNVIGWKHEIESTEPQDLIAFHDKWFAPNNAMILIVGNIDLDRIKLLVDKYFSKIKSKSIMDLKEDQSRPQQIKKIELRSPKVSFANLHFAYSVPFSIQTDLRKCIALKIACNILNQPAFLVSKTLVNTLNKANSVDFSYDPGEFRYDISEVSICCSKIDDLEDCEELWEYIKNKIFAVGITSKELDEAKRRFQLSSAYDHDIYSISSDIWTKTIKKLTLKQILEWDDIVQSISIEEINAVLREVFCQPQISVSKLLPKNKDRDLVSEKAS